MISIYSSKFTIYVVVLLQFLQSIPVQSSNTLITECAVVERHTHENDGEHIHAILRCSAKSNVVITPAIGSSSTALNCSNKTIDTSTVRIITINDCFYTSLPHQLLSSFKALHQLRLTGLSLEILQNGDIPILQRSENSAVILDISHNKLAHIANGTFSDQFALDILYLGQNSIKDINGGMLAGLTQVKELWLDRNGIVEISNGAFAQLRKLERLRLNENHLQTIDSSWFDKVNNLLSLRIPRNNIVELKAECFVNLRNLTEIDLASNAIVNLPPGVFAQLPKLEKLYLMNNMLQAIDSLWFRPINSIDFLSLLNNPITELKRNNFQHLANLISLDISHALISTIDDGTFQPLQKLKYLNISFNRLTQLDVTKLFTPGYRKLVWLHSHDNLLTDYPEKLRDTLPGLLVFDVTNNPIQCNCSKKHL